MLSASQKMVGLGLLAIFFITIDRWFKAVAWQALDQQSLEITSWLKIKLQLNSGVAFSLPWSAAFNFIIALLIISLIVAWLRFKKQGQWLSAGWLLFVILGATSNLYDRFKYGAVIDYLDLKYFSVFNLADVLICLGALGFIWLERRRTIKKQSVA